MEFESSVFEGATREVASEVYEDKGDAAEVLELAVDRFDLADASAGQTD